MDNHDSQNQKLHEYFSKYEKRMVNFFILVVIPFTLIVTVTILFNTLIEDAGNTIILLLIAIAMLILIIFLTLYSSYKLRSELHILINPSSKYKVFGQNAIVQIKNLVNPRRRIFVIGKSFFYICKGSGGKKIQKSVSSDKNDFYLLPNFKKSFHILTNIEGEIFIYICSVKKCKRMIKKLYPDKNFEIIKLTDDSEEKSEDL